MRLRITVEQKTIQKSDQAEVIVDMLKTSSVRITLILVLFVSSLLFSGTFITLMYECAPPLLF